MATPPAFALFSVWACCRCRRQGQWELVVPYLPLSWEICWGSIVQVIFFSGEDPFSNTFPAVLWLRYLWFCLTATRCAYNTIHPLCCPVGWTSHTLNQTPHVYLCCLLQLMSRQGLQFRHQRVQWLVWKLFLTLLMNSLKLKSGAANIQLWSRTEFASSPNSKTAVDQ